MIISFKNFLFAFPRQPHGPETPDQGTANHKGVESIFSTVSVMSAVQNETLTN